MKHRRSRSKSRRKNKSRRLEKFSFGVLNERELYNRNKRKFFINDINLLLEEEIHNLKKIRSNLYIKKGTYLFHSSLDGNLDYKNFEIMFFGLDIEISLWYVLEMYFKFKENFIPNEPTLYIFKTNTDIPVYIIEDIQYGPKNVKRCKLVTCLHPQLAYVNSGTKWVERELFTEITLPKRNYDKIELVDKLPILLGELDDNKYNEDYDPRNSLTTYDNPVLKEQREFIEKNHIEWVMSIINNDFKKEYSDFSSSKFVKYLEPNVILFSVEFRDGYKTDLVLYDIPKEKYEIHKEYLFKVNYSANIGYLKQDRIRIYNVKNKSTIT